MYNVFVSKWHPILNVVIKFVELVIKVMVDKSTSLIELYVSSGSYHVFIVHLPVLDRCSRFLFSILSIFCFDTRSNKFLNLVF